MKRSISIFFLDTIPNNGNAKQLFNIVNKKYAGSSKAEAEELIYGLTNMRYDGTGDVRAYIMSLESIASKLKSLDIPIPNNFVDPLIPFLHSLISLKLLI